MQAINLTTTTPKTKQTKKKRKENKMHAIVKDSRQHGSTLNAKMLDCLKCSAQKLLLGIMHTLLNLARISNAHLLLKHFLTKIVSTISACLHPKLFLIPATKA